MRIDVYDCNMVALYGYESEHLPVVGDMLSHCHSGSHTFTTIVVTSRVFAIFADRPPAVLTVTTKEVINHPYDEARKAHDNKT